MIAAGTVTVRIPARDFGGPSTNWPFVRSVKAARIRTVLESMSTSQRRSAVISQIPRRPDGQWAAPCQGMLVSGMRYLTRLGRRTHGKIGPLQRARSPQPLARQACAVAGRNRESTGADCEESWLSGSQLPAATLVKLLGWSSDAGVVAMCGQVSRTRQCRIAPGWPLRICSTAPEGQTAFHGVQFIAVTAGQSRAVLVS
jgi:hypothetical protein